MYANTHLEADYFISVKTWVYFGWIGGTDTRRANAWWDYIRLKPGYSVNEANASINNLVGENMGFLMTENKTAKFHLQSLKELHYTSDIKGGMGASTNKKSLTNLLMIAILTIIIAYINHINLSTAQAFRGSHEIGIRKLIGATKKHLLSQAVLESSLLI